MGRVPSVFYPLLAMILVCFALGAGSTQEGSIPKIAIPDIANQRAARNRVNQIFTADIAKAKKPGEKTAIAKKLLQTADDTGNDASVKYVALSMARELAVSDGDADAAFAAIAGLEAFAIDGLKLKTDTLIAILKSTGSPQDTLVGAVVEEAIGADHFSIARQLAETSLSTAKLAADAGAVGNANAWVREIKEVEAASGAANKAAITLSTKPDDPLACLTVGRFEAFFKNHWEKGLPLLASGNDAPLKSLAQTELAAATDPAKRVQVADGWWAISMKERGIAQSHIREHAGHWYKAALPTLSGLEKVRAQNRVKDGAIVRTSYTGWLDVLRKVNIERDAVNGKCSLERGMLSMSARAKIKVAPKPPKTYAVRIEFIRPNASDSGSTLGIILPIVDKQVVVNIDPTRMGMDIVDGKRWFANEAIIKKGDFGGAKKKHLVEVTVWQDDPEARILVLVDGKPHLEWTGSPSRLSSTGDWSLQPPAIGIGTWDQALTITGIAVRESAE